MRLSPAIALVLLLAAPAAAVAQAGARGAPGVKPTWAKADKHAFGTAHARRSNVWFTLRRAEMSEAFWPDLGTPAVRELEFAVAGPDGVERETRDGEGVVERLGGLTYRQTVTARSGAWRLTKTWFTDPRRDAVLADLRFESLRGKRLKLFVLFDPQLTNDGSDDRGGTHFGGDALVAWDRRSAAALTLAPGMRRATSGYRGPRDAWADLRRDGRIDRLTRARRPGNVRQAARIPLSGRPGSRRGRLALGFARTPRSAARVALRAWDQGYDVVRRRSEQGWARYLASLKPPPAAAAPVARAYETSVLMLAAHEDKRNPGASVASPSMPWTWGQLTLERPQTGAYHLVWSRDLYQVATAQIAAGDVAAARRSLDFLLFRQQKSDGSFPQNSQVDGTEKWTEQQLDQTAFPIVLAHQLGQFDRRRWLRVRRAADFIVRTGPRTGQERWENQSGWSPATIAAEIAGLVCAADIARRRGAPERAARYERTADRWAVRVQDWTATTSGPLSPAPYYLRIAKAASPDRGTRYRIGDGGPARVDQRRVVDPSFLELVRLGIKPADDPVIVNTLRVVDGQLRADTPNGAFWHRFSFDGYGERRNGGEWEPTDDGSRATLGRAWPIFAGERGEYELLAGRPAAAHLRAMAAAGNDGGMIAEQVWDGRPPTAPGRFPAGEGTFAATPLAWSHAQLVRLAWSIESGGAVEQPAIVACRYVRACAP